MNKGKFEKEQLAVWSKKNWKYILTAVFALFIGSVAGPSTDELASANQKAEEVEAKLAEAENMNKELISQNSKLQDKVDEAAPWFKMSEEEQKQVEAEAKAAEEKRLAEEQAKKEAEEKAKKEAEEKEKAEAEAKAKQGYNTGITYNQLARTPADYIAEKVKFRGKVIQVMEGDGTIQIRLAVNSDYDTILLGEFDSSITSSRILEDDVITIYGTSAGIISYQSTLGGTISIPGVMVEKID